MYRLSRFFGLVGQRSHLLKGEDCFNPGVQRARAGRRSAQSWHRKVCFSGRASLLWIDHQSIRLHRACTEYHGYIQKKKEYTSVEEGVKMLPIDALGAVMMSHGEEFGDDSAFGNVTSASCVAHTYRFYSGQSLLKLGRAHCKIATLQETYALTFRDTYLASLEDTLDELNDYAIQRKKLDSRRYCFTLCLGLTSLSEFCKVGL